MFEPYRLGIVLCEGNYGLRSGGVIVVQVRGLNKYSLHKRGLKDLMGYQRSVSVKTNERDGFFLQITLVRATMIGDFYFIEHYHLSCLYLYQNQKYFLTSWIRRPCTNVVEIGTGGWKVLRFTS